jgi:hypothetical protein
MFLNHFYLLISKIIFKKIKKYYFNIFSKKTFKKTTLNSYVNYKEWLIFFVLSCVINGSFMWKKVYIVWFFPALCVILNNKIS